MNSDAFREARNNSTEELKEISDLSDYDRVIIRRIIEQHLMFHTGQ